MKISTITAAAVLAVAASRSVSAAPRHFFLKNGDRVMFYGDSITEQRFYPADVETYVTTRFPKLHIQFTDSGVGGDKVGGGWAGPIDQRLKRDVFPFKPNVVTIMLAMNDAGYQPFNQQLFNTYKAGYKHIIASLKAHLPHVRIVLIQPSPYDDVTQKPGFPGGYNAVLIRYGNWVKKLAAKNHLMCVDFNTPLVKVMRDMEKTNKGLAGHVVPGRVHPSAAGEVLMAQALLKAWGAPATVSRVALSAARQRTVAAQDSSISQVSFSHGKLSWTELDKCLPMPVMALHDKWPQFPPMDLWTGPQRNLGWTNRATAMMLHFSRFYRALDQENLTVSGLHGSKYNLSIDGKNAGTFTASQLAKGINLARYNTPMMAQAYHVQRLVWRRMNLRFVAWHNVQLLLEGKGWGPEQPVKSKKVHQAARAFERAMYAHANHDLARDRAAAKPRPHHFVLTPAG